MAGSTHSGRNALDNDNRCVIHPKRTRRSNRTSLWFDRKSRSRSKGLGLSGSIGKDVRTPFPTGRWMVRKENPHGFQRASKRNTCPYRNRRWKRKSPSLRNEESHEAPSNFRAFRSSLRSHRTKTCPMLLACVSNVRKRFLRLEKTAANDPIGPSFRSRISLRFTCDFEVNPIAFEKKKKDGILERKHET